MLAIPPCNLRLIRKARKFTQEDLAARVGKSKTAISRYEGEGLGSADVSTLQALASVLDVTPGQILGYERFPSTGNDLDRERLMACTEALLEWAEDNDSYFINHNYLEAQLAMYDWTVSAGLSIDQINTPETLSQVSAFLKWGAKGQPRRNHA